MDGKIKKILNAVVVICVVVWLLFAFGVINHTGDITVPQINGHTGVSPINPMSPSGSKLS
jgi:hypothetical protein